MTAAQALGQAPRRLDRFAPDTSRVSAGGIAFVASAVVPGAGQFYLKSDRWVPFIAIEAWAWARYGDRHKRSRELEREYRDLAWKVARQFTTSTRKDSAFTYYEAMGNWHDSGQFDIDPQSVGIQPELDTTTFNGTQWERARALYVPPGVPLIPGTPAYERALAFYRANAIPEPYLWSWGNSNLEQQAFRETIHRSDAAFRDATRMMGVILANHVVSAVDALVLARVKLLTEHRIRIGSTLEPAGSKTFWTATVQIPLRGAKRGRYTGTDR